MPRNRYMSNYMICQALLLPLFFAVRKFFESQVQVPMRFLTRPVTADHTHYDAGTDQHAHDYKSSLHHMSVPFILPSTTLIAIAEMNTPVSMYNKSI